jgi:hypothetical protein
MERDAQRLDPKGKSPVPEGDAPMKKFELTKGKGRLYFDGISFIRLDHNGSGCCMDLTAEEMLSLSKALWRAAKPFAA